MSASNESQGGTLCPGNFSPLVPGKLEWLVILLEFHFYDEDTGVERWGTLLQVRKPVGVELGPGQGSKFCNATSLLLGWSLRAFSSPAGLCVI